MLLADILFKWISNLEKWIEEKREPKRAFLIIEILKAFAKLDNARKLNFK